MKNKETSNDKKITRKEAIIKAGKYAAITSVATFLILNPKQSQADSPSPPGWGEAKPPSSSKEDKNKSFKA